MPGWLRSPWVIGAAALALIAGGLLWASTVFVPRLVRNQAAAWTQENLGLALAMGEVRFDPFRVALDIDGVAIPAGDAPMVTTGPIHVDFAFSSLLADSWRFDSIRVEEPRIDARLAADGSLNLSKLLPPPDDEPLPPVLIADLRVARGQVAFTDLTKADARTRLLPVDFELRDLHTTRDEGGRFRLSGASEAGETLAWTGTVSLAPLGSTGGVALRAIDGERAGRFLGDTIPTRILKGKGDLTLSYRASYAEGRPTLAVTAPRILLRDVVMRVRPDVLAGEATAGAVDVRNFRFDLGPQGKDTHWSVGADGMAGARLRLVGTDAARGEELSIRLLRYTAISAASDRQGLHAAQLGVEGLDLVVVREPGGGIGLAKFLPAGGGEDDGGAPTPLVIDEIAIADSRLVFDERSTPRRQRYEIAPLAATIRGFAMGGGSPLQVEASAEVNGRPLAVSGTVEPGRPAADLGVKLDRLPLALALPYLPDFPALELISGTLSVDGRVTAAPDRRGSFDLGFDGAVDVADFRLRELIRNSDLFRFRAFRMSGIRFDGREVTIAEGRLVAPIGQVALLADGQFNYGFLLDEAVSVEEAAARLERPRAPAAKPTRAERRAAEEAAEAERAARAAARAAPKRAAQPDLPLTMKRLTIEGGTLAFADLVIEPDFQAEIRALNGRITNLTNIPGRVSDIDLRGHVVDRFSPVVIRGDMNLFDFAEATDMHLEFRNIDLPVFNPYSGTYAGYAIAKGKLTTELDYRIANAALEANHKVRIDQLEWGEATESKEKVGLPVRFATSVMKDKNGVIEFELPVTGSVDDPEFSLAPLVWKFLGQFVGKLVTAPFRALGGLFADKEDAQFVDFAPGSAALPEGSAETLAEIGKALGDKPELRVDIPASPGIEADARAIAAERLEAALMVRERKKDLAAGFEALPPDRQHKRMQDLYRVQLKKKPAFAEAAEGEAKDARLEREVGQMEEELMASYLPGADELAALGRARADAVRLALLSPGTVDAGRVFVDAGDPLVVRDDRVRMELKLK